ncbi:MAG: type II CAAX endopeptidase family protein [Actinomycetia bacterium]|nr:type II CAAX endopeptidase family protein [Actinomycetes bacterium]
MSTPPQPPGYPPQGSYPGPYAPPPLQKPSALPLEPVEYQHVLRGPRYAPWRPLVSLLLVIAGVAIATIAILILAMIGYVGASRGDLGPIEEMALDLDNPITFGVQNLWLAALIPVAMLATWAAHGVRPGFVSSVLGRFRWGWFGWCLLLITPIWLSYVIGATLVVEGSLGDTAGRPSTWVVLLVLTLLTTPLQAAGEEYVFRGWLMQQIGAYIKHTYVALALAVVISATLFALAHASLDPWILLDLGAFATAAVLLTWRTGGLEAAVALHIVNNVIVLILSVLTTGIGSAIITSETTSSPGTTLLSVAVLALTTAALWWLAGRRDISRRTTPPALPPAGGWEQVSGAAWSGRGA